MADIMLSGDEGDRLGMYDDLTEGGARLIRAATYLIVWAPGGNSIAKLI